MFVLPSGLKVLARESNGDDDAIFSRVVDILSGDNIPNYIASVVEKDFSLGRKPQPEDIKNWRINDRNIFLIKQRILNHGSDLIWEHTCSNPDCIHHKKPFEVIEDLKLYDLNYQDYYEGSPEEKAEFLANITTLQFPPFESSGTEIVFEVEKVGKFKFQFYTQALEEEYNKNVEMEKRSSNSTLLLRKLQTFKNDQWQDVKFFIEYKSRVMSILRGYVMKYDPVYEPTTEIRCPKCGTIDVRNLLTLPDFYLPGVKI